MATLPFDATATRRVPYVLLQNLEHHSPLGKLYHYDASIIRDFTEHSLRAIPGLVGLALLTIFCTHP